MKKLILFTILTLMLTGCGDDSGSSTAGSCRDVFNTWTSTDGVIFNLNDMSYDTAATFQLNFTSGAQCQFNLTVSGSSCSGTLLIESSTYTGGGSGDPGCSSLNGTDNYTISGSTLTACDSTNTTTCEVYQ